MTQQTQRGSTEQTTTERRSLIERIRLFLFRTTLGRTRKDKNEV